MNMEMPKMPKRVSVEEADNGFTVRGQDEKGKEIIMIAKDMEEVQGHMMSMMRNKMGEYKEESKRSAKFKKKL